jgi:hypothetical protein
MRRFQFALALFFAMVTIGFVRTAEAQRWDWDDEGTVKEFRSFDVFLHDHPWIAKKLWERPGRVNDRDFLNDNKEIKQWLEDHPRAAEAFHADPGAFMERERHFQIYSAEFESGDRRHGQLASFDWFLDNHPDIRRELMRHPGLVDNREYLEHHPELRGFLEKHPELREHLQEHPREFMEREARYEHAERDRE